MRFRRSRIVVRHFLSLLQYKPYEAPAFNHSKCWSRAERLTIAGTDCSGSRKNSRADCFPPDQQGGIGGYFGVSNIRYAIAGTCVFGGRRGGGASHIPRSYYASDILVNMQPRTLPVSPSLSVQCKPFSFFMRVWACAFTLMTTVIAGVLAQIQNSVKNLCEA